MILKLLGAIFVIAGCGVFGFYLAAGHRRQEAALRQLISVLDYMECELQYRLTPLPELCRQAARECSGVLKHAFLELSRELEDQIAPDVQRCMTAALSKCPDMPSRTLEALQLLGRSLGRFDIDGQLKGLEAVRQECRRSLGQLAQNREYRIRSYQTLGICAGAALAILFI